MDLDLNQEPMDSPQGSMSGLGSLLNELEAAHGCIEERIRQLEAVTSRARQRQRWRQSQTTPQMVNVSVQHTAAGVHGVDRLLNEVEVGAAIQERRTETGKVGKRNGSYLIAKALGMDTDSKKVRGSFFDCNICLDIARDPVLTCCGHLFCWPCFYQLSYVYSNVKECPVCMEEITDRSIIPIYGNGHSNDSHKFKESGLKVPPRPRAHRIESVRQKLINNGVFSSPIEERIQQFSNMIAALGERNLSQDIEGAATSNERTNVLASQSHTSQLTSQLLPASGTEGSQRHHSFQVSRLLLQGAVSFSSLSSALNSAMDSAERLIEDLEAFINSRHVRRNHQQSPRVADRDSFSSFSAVIRPDGQTPVTLADTDSTVPPSASSLTTDGAATVVQLENPRRVAAIESNSSLSISYSRRRNEFPRLSEADNSIEIDSVVPHTFSSSRRRHEVAGVSDANDRLDHESRRRRLR